MGQEPKRYAVHETDMMVETLVEAVAEPAPAAAFTSSIHGESPASSLCRIIKWNWVMISRASTRVGTPASIAATMTVSTLVSESRLIVMRRAIFLADRIR